MNPNSLTDCDTASYEDNDVHDAEDCAWEAGTYLGEAGRLSIKELEEDPWQG
jgi:hypothetical protein